MSHGNFMVDRHDPYKLHFECDDCGDTGHHYADHKEFLEFAREEIFNHMNKSVARYCLLIQEYKRFKREGTIPCQCKRRSL